MLQNLISPQKIHSSPVTNAAEMRLKAIRWEFRWEKKYWKHEKIFFVVNLKQLLFFFSHIGCILTSISLYRDYISRHLTLWRGHKLVSEKSAKPRSFCVWKCFFLFFTFSFRPTFFLFIKKNRARYFLLWMACCLNEEKRRRSVCRC